MSKTYNPPHPGEVLAEYLPEAITVTEAARCLGVSRVTLSRLLNGKAGMSADMALRLSDALNTSADMWVSMQSAYDLWHAAQKPRPKVESLTA